MGLRKDHLGALLEDMDDKLDAIIESLSFMATSAQLQAVDERLQRVESDMQIVKRDIGEYHKWLTRHDLQFAKLKAI